MTQNNQGLFNGAFGSKRDTPLMNEWKRHIHASLAACGPNISWEQIGNQFLNETHDRNVRLFDEYVIYDGPNTMYPVNWDRCVSAYLDKPYWTHRHLTRDFQPLLVLVNSVYKALESLTKEQILASEYPLNYFINKSLRQLLV